jgi:Ca2+-transporting ATPase
MDTEIGRIAGLMNGVRERRTPLQISMDKLGRQLAVFVILICILVLGLCIYRKMDILASFMFAVALAVAAIPEALGSVVTIVQAIGMQRMAKENAVIKDLGAVESLGCVSVICSDKTGTLTQNRMTVKSIYINERVLKPDEIRLSDKVQRMLLYNAVLNNDSCIAAGKEIGDQTECALLKMFRDIFEKHNKQCGGLRINEEDIREMFLRREELPFDSERKLMSSKYDLDGVSTVFTKGAADVLLERCTHIMTADKISPITMEVREKIKAQNELYSESGMRVLAFAYKHTQEKLTAKTEQELIFVGLTAMADPPRPESAEAVRNAKIAGIRPIMITGDHKLTATAIAKEIGIFEEGDMALTGAQLDAMSENELDAVVERISVYARVSPENKLRIVKAWQKKSHIVSMTGDGVNDAPALKKADIGIAMGVAGTEVAKDASLMILSDDNFATIIKAVINGRNVYRNIKNSVLYLLSGNMAAIIAVLYTSLLGLSVPFEPVQLLFINLLTDSMPAIAIGMEPAQPALLKEKPRNPSAGILTKDYLTGIFIQGGLIAACVLTAYHIGLGSSNALASTMAFMTLTLARLFHGFNCRSAKSIFCIGLGSNKYSVYAFLAGIALLFSVLFIPALREIFSVILLSGVQLTEVCLLAVMPSVFIQLKKCMNSRRDLHLDDFAL